jgi:hypothetical protein
LLEIQYLTMMDSLDLALAHFGDVYTEQGHVQCPRGHVLADDSSFCARCRIFVEGCYRESCRELLNEGESSVLMRVVQYEHAHQDKNGEMILAKVTVKTLNVAPPLVEDDIVGITICPYCGTVIGGSDEVQYALKKLLVPDGAWANNFADYLSSRAIS